MDTNCINPTKQQIKRREHIANFQYRKTTGKYKPTLYADLPKPQRPHVTLTKEDIMDRSIFVIGDVHGCVEELKDLMDKVHETHPDCFFLFCGDLVNKGPYSLQCLRFVRDLGPKKALSIRGNHEEYIMNHWYRWQQDTSVVPSGSWGWYKELTEEDMDYLEELPYTISIPHLNTVVVHAGLLPGIKLEKQHPWDMTELKGLEHKSGPVEGWVGTKVVGSVPWGQVWSSQGGENGSSSMGAKPDGEECVKKDMDVDCKENGSVPTKSEISVYGSDGPSKEDNRTSNHENEHNSTTYGKEEHRTKKQTNLLNGQDKPSESITPHVYFEPNKEDNRTSNPENDHKNSTFYEKEEDRRHDKPSESITPHVYFGHDAGRGLQLWPYATGLDTGCVFGRQLTGQFVTGDRQIVSVQARMVYYQSGS